jgi:hypothetical protein
MVLQMERSSIQLMAKPGKSIRRTAADCKPARTTIAQPRPATRTAVTGKAFN